MEDKLKDMMKQKDISTKQYSIKMVIDSYNKRLRLDDYQGNINHVIYIFEKIAHEEQVQKLIIKGRRKDYHALLENGYQCEGVIDHYFLGSDAYLFCKYLTKERKTNIYWIEEDKILKNVQKLDKSNEHQPVPKDYQLIKISKQDAIPLATLYQKVFEIYPTPLHDPKYIEKTIDNGTIYFAFKNGEKIVCSASAERNVFYKNAELTDCATLPEHRKHGLLKILLLKLEEELVHEGIYYAYSLARALSFGMNAALHQLGYSYRGRLMNNCYIFDKLENMNVWVKDLSK